MLVKRKDAGIVFSFCSLLMAGGAVQAYEPGNMILRLGVATVDPNESSSKISINNSATAGTSAGLGSDTQLGITGTYMIDSNWGVGLLLATPFKHDAVANGLGVDIGTSKQLPPTLTAQYHFTPDPKLSLYLGAGINYTTFFEEDISDELKTALGGASNMKIDDSVGLAFEAGVDYKITKNILVNFSAWYIDISTEANIDSAAGPVSIDIDIDPWVYMLGLGYQFN